MAIYRAGEPVEDLCRACKVDRAHTVIVADLSGRPLRVQCDYCGSQHHFRGGARETTPAARSSAPIPRDTGSAGASTPFPLVSDRERAKEPLMVDPTGEGPIDIETLLRRVIREETGLTPVVPAEKWRGGSLVLRPSNAALQERAWPIETFFSKVVMIRNRLRTLEQQVNALDLPADVKVKMQGYITGCYGSLTSFNVLFADEEDQFKGSGGE
jgi:hypothetical protein